MPFKFSMASESLQLYLAWLYLQLYSNNKQGIHLAVAFNIFKSGFNILCTVGFPQPVISDRSCTMCLLSLLTVYSTFVTLPVFLRGRLLICPAAGLPSQNLKSNLYTKACVTFRWNLPCFTYFKVSSGVILDSKQKCITVCCSDLTSHIAIFSPPKFAQTCFNRIWSLRKWCHHFEIVWQNM